jgi:hypothetical protein
MAELATMFTSVMAGGGSAAAGAAAGGMATAGSGLFTLLQGGASLLSIISGLEADNQQAEALQLQALDAEEEVVQENLRGIERRSSLRAEAQQIAGETAVAFAAGGQDLTFGSPTQARKEVYRELDTSLSADNATRTSRISRLNERASGYRSQARKVKRGSGLKAFTKALQFGGSVINRG